MKYKILIKSDNGFYSYAKHKVEITESVTDISGNTVQVGTGKYEIVDFESEDVATVKTKYIELLNNHFKVSLNIVADVNEIVSFSVDVEEVSTSTSGGSSDDSSSNNGQCNCPANNEVADDETIRDIFEDTTNE